MADREYRVLVAATQGGLVVAADGGWTILDSTICKFARLDTNDDHSLGNIGAIDVGDTGYVALAYRDIG